MMGTWNVSFSMPVRIDVVVEADTEEEAIEIAEKEADWQQGEEDGVLDLIEAVEEEGDDE
jgi:hypothetical protein